MIFGSFSSPVTEAYKLVTLVIHLLSNITMQLTLVICWIQFSWKGME